MNARRISSFVAAAAFAALCMGAGGANAQSSSVPPAPPTPASSSPATAPAPGNSDAPAPQPVPTAGVGDSSPAPLNDADQPTGPLSLDSAVKLALARNHDVIAAALNALQAEQGYYATRGVILPNLSFNAAISNNRSGSTEAGTTQVLGHVITVDPQNAQVYRNYSWGLTLQQLVFDGGAWWNNLDASSLNFKSLKETAEEQRLQTTYQVTQAFLELVRAQKQLAVFEEAARRSRDQADFEEKLYNGGKAAQADVYAARANRDNDEVNRLTGEALVEQNRFALATLVGYDPSQPVTVVEPVEIRQLPPAPPSPSRAVESALANRPSLRAFEFVLASTRKATSGLKGRYYPSVSLALSYNRNSQKFGDVVASPDETSFLSGSVNLNWNLFNGLSDISNVRKSELQELSNENDLQQGKRQVASDVQTAIANLSGARQRAQVAGQAEDTANEGLRLAKARQAVGVGTELDVRDAELKLTQAQLAHVNALVDGREQLAALKRAMGSDPSAVGTPALPHAESSASRNIGG